jgi:hypothetical protein
MADDKHVYVYKDEVIIGSDYKAYPPIVILRGNDKFQIVNTTDETASWVAPDVLEEDKEGPQGANQQEDIKPKQKSKFWRVRKKELAVVEYKIKVGAHHAHGNSDPRIIIDP